jgi:hypothetical protein
MRRKSERYDPGYELFCSEVMKRDGHKCQWPDCNKSTRLEVHHIQRYADNPYLRTDPRNGVTLCSTHHWLVRGKEQYYAALLQAIVDDNLTG